MSSDHFGQLPQLEDLQIKYCKLRTLPAAAFAGLTSLKRLALQSHNAVIMEMHSDAFQVCILIHRIVLYIVSSITLQIQGFLA